MYFREKVYKKLLWPVLRNERLCAVMANGGKSRVADKPTNINRLTIFFNKSY